MKLHRITLMAMGILALALLTALGQGISGPTVLDDSDQGTFILTVSNTSASASACQISLTNTLPNTTFSYVTGSSTLTLHTGASYSTDPSIVG